VLSPPLADSVTAVPATGLPLACSTVTVSVVADVSLAATVVGFATMVDIAGGRSGVHSNSDRLLFSSAPKAVSCVDRDTVGRQRVVIVGKRGQVGVHLVKRAGDDQNWCRYR
jgi:hypothetical protein